MKVDQLLALDSDEQFDWLKLKYAAEAKLADEDIEFHISMLAWDDPLGSIVTPDLSILDDMLKYPDSYDLGWRLQERLSDMPDARAIQINDGDRLTPNELKLATEIETDDRINDAYENLEGLLCAGSTVTLEDTNAVFISFTGESLGQGGIDYAFHRIFANRQAAVKHFESQPGIWLPLYS